MVHGVGAVVIAATDLLPAEVAALLKVIDDALDGANGDPHGVTEVPLAQLRVLAQA